MPLGPRDTSSLVMLTGWDATELKEFELADGTSFANVLSMMNAGLGALNAELYAHPLFSKIVSYTDMPEVEYRVGTSTRFEQHTEYGLPDAQRAETAGHMLPYLEWDYGLGWTYDYLKRARMAQVAADLRAANDAARDKYRIGLLSRLFKRGDDTGNSKGLGATGISPGFATAAAATGVDFVPPGFGGNTFTEDHEHYVAIAGGVITDNVFADIVADLREHGHEPTYDVIVSPLDAAAVKALDGTVEVASRLVRYGSDQDLANIAQSSITPGIYPIGVNNDCVIWSVPGVPRYYAFGWKSYGANSARNPLRVRLEKGRSRPQIYAMRHPNANQGYFPLQNMYVFFNFAVGVGEDRTNGTARYVNNATWTDGQPS